MAFVVRERRRAGPVVVLELSGRLTMGEGSDQLEEALQGLLNQGERAVLLDCAGVPVIDSRGLKALVQGYTSLEKRGGTLKLLRVSPRVREVLDYTHLLTVIQAFDDEEAAVKSF